MLLYTALMKSMHGLATRRKAVSLTHGKVRYEYHMAAASPLNVVHVLNGRNGTIRRMTAEDQSRDDWEPFQARVKVEARRFKIKAPKEGER